MAATDNMALDLVLRTLMSSSEFCETKDKNWVALAALIPQTSAQQVNVFSFVQLALFVFKKSKAKGDRKCVKVPINLNTKFVLALL